MSAAVTFCDALLHAHGSLARKLDDELGTHHGLALQDFWLLRLLASAPQGLPVVALARPLGKAPSAVVRQLLPLEKTGLVQRMPGGGSGGKQVLLCASGRTLAGEAAVTADAICAQALRGQPAAALDTAHALLQVLGSSPALEV